MARRSTDPAGGERGGAFGRPFFLSRTPGRFRAAGEFGGRHGHCRCCGAGPHPSWAGGRDRQRGVSRGWLRRQACNYREYQLVALCSLERGLGMPSPLVLERATCVNGIFEALKRQWTDQVPDVDEFDYYSTLMEHAERIACENQPDKRYGIFVLRSDTEHGTSYEAFAHVNHAIQHPAGPTVRMVWNLLAPKYEFGDSSQEQIAELAASFLYGASNFVVARCRRMGLRCICITLPTYGMHAGLQVHYGTAA